MKQKQPKFSGILVVAVLMVLVLFIVSLSPLLAASGSKDTTYSEIYYYFENQQVTSFRLDLGTGSLELWLKEGKAALPESNAAASLPTGGLLTGVYSHRHGQTTLSYGIMDTTLVHFPELLRAEGYLTAIFGKWHLSVEPKGFDHYDLLWDQGEYYNPVMRTPETGGRYVRQEGYATDIITDHALAWLDARRDDDAPFCLMIHHKAPHRNWMADLKYLDLYEDVEFPEPETLFDDYATRGDQMRQQQLTIDRHMGYAFDFKVEELKDEPTLQYIHDSWDIAMSTLTPEQRRVWDDSYGRKNRDFLADRPEGKELLRWKYQRYIHDYCRTIRSVDDQDSPSRKGGMPVRAISCSRI